MFLETLKDIANRNLENVFSKGLEEELGVSGQVTQQIIDSLPDDPPENNPVKVADMKVSNNASDSEDENIDQNLEDSIMEILGDYSGVVEEQAQPKLINFDPDNNLFIKTLREEYGEKAENIIKLLYLTPRQLTKSEFKQLNDEIYDIVYNIIKERKTATAMVATQFRDNRNLNIGAMGVRTWSQLNYETYSIDSMLNCYEAAATADDHQYNFHMYNYPAKTLFAWERPELMGAPRNLTAFMSSFLGRYNETVEAEEDKLEQDLFAQLGEVDEDQDVYGVKVLRYDTEKLLDSMTSVAYDCQIKTGTNWIGVPAATGLLNRYLIGDYTGNPEYTDNFIQKILNEKNETLFMEAGRSEEFFHKYFRKETALEDLIRITIAMGGDGCNRTDTALDLPMKTRMLPLIPDASDLFVGSPGDCHFMASDETVADLMRTIINPVSFMTMNGLSLLCIEGLDKEVVPSAEGRAESLLESFLNAALNPAILYQMLFVKTGEAMMASLSETMADVLKNFITSHPAYLKLLELEKDFNENDGNIQTEEHPEKVASRLKDVNIMNERPGIYDFIQKKMQDVFRVASSTRSVTTAVSLVANLLSHKLWPLMKNDMDKHVLYENKNERLIVAGLSSALIHYVSYKEKENVLVASPVTFYMRKGEYDPQAFCDIYFKEIRELADDIGGKGKPVAFIQDATEFVITSGSPIIYSTERNIVLHKCFKETRDTLTKDVFIVSTDRPLSRWELVGIEHGDGNGIGRSTGKDGSKPATIVKNNLAEHCWPEMPASINDLLYTGKLRYGGASDIQCCPEEFGEKARDFKPLRHHGRPVFRCVFISEQKICVMNDYILSILQCRINRNVWSTNPKEMFENKYFACSSVEGNDNKLLYILENQAVGSGYGYATSKEGTPLTVWNSRLLKMMKSEDKKHNIFGKGCRISGSLMIPLVYHKKQYDLTAVTSSSAPKGSYGYVLSFYDTGKNTFTMDDVLSSAWDLVTIGVPGEKDPEEEEHVTLSTDIHFGRMDWKSISTARSRRNTAIPAIGNIPDNLRYIGRSSDSERTISLLKWNKMYAYGLNPSMNVKMITNSNATDVTFFFGPEYESCPIKQFTSRAREAFSSSMLMSDMLVYKKDTPEIIEMEDLDEETIQRDNGDDIFNKNVCLYLTDDKTPEYRSFSDTKEDMADELTNKYSGFIINEKKKKADSLKRDMAAAYNQYKEYLKKVEDADAEIKTMEESLEHKSDVFSSVNTLRRLVNDGTILDYTPSSNDRNMTVVLSAPRIWVGGYIYIMSPCIVSVPLEIRYAETHIHAKAVKDLMSMQLEALKFLGKKYGLQGLGDLYKSNDAFYNLHPSLSSCVYDYPHIHDSSGCMGSHSTELQNAVGTGDLGRYIKTIKEYIKSVTLTDGYGKGIISWPAIPATMFNLLKHGLMGSMDVTLDSRIVIPGKKSLFQDKSVRGQTKYTESSPAAMIDVRDITPEILQYLLEEADSIEGETDYEYMHSFGSDYYKYISTAFVSPTVYGGDSLKSLYNNPERFKNARRCADMMLEYAYLTQGSGAGQRAQKASRDIVVQGIQNIKSFREAIRKCPPNGTDMHFEGREWHRSLIVEPIVLEGDTVIFGNREIKEKAA